MRCAKPVLWFLRLPCAVLTHKLADTERGWETVGQTVVQRRHERVAALSL